jgi:hypothetical protein
MMMLYERDQAFGGAQLTQLIVRQYGFSQEEAEGKKRNGDLPEDYESAVLRALRGQPGAGNRPRPAVSSSPARPTTVSHLHHAGGRLGTRCTG